ncbi:DUF4913 domain-containing protein [Nocardioides sp. GXZ039]|uniref:DUF4913 domain-containing protein n=1 Tax=Nocardioides sp. GXZ039 TaxID=3136018 RepID=UPI0030F3D6C6
MTVPGAEVERRLRAAETDIAELRTHTTDITDAVGSLAESVKVLTKRSSRPTGGGGSEAEPTAWALRATDDDWAALADWVDGLLTTYELSECVAPCWPSHGGVVEELAALRSAWRAAAAKSAEEDDDAMSFWHDRALYPTITRIMSTFYPINGCRNGHRTSETVRPTDRRTIALANPSKGCPSWPSR